MRFLIAPIARYRFTATAQAPLQLPPYAGSLLRGQFGAALRHVACMTRQPKCPGCPLLETCPYTRIFEAPPPPKGSHALQEFSNIPNPYVIEPPALQWGAPPQDRLIGEGEALQFNLVLVGHARDQLALIVFSLQRALAQGLGKDRSPLFLTQVEWLGADGAAQTIWQPDAPVLVAHDTTLAAPTVATQSIADCDKFKADTATLSLQIHTPMRLQSQGRPLRLAQLTTRALVSTLARRMALLMDFHAPGTPAPHGHANWGEAARAITHLATSLGDERDLRWFDWTRYSSRQQQEMTLGGVMGQWTLRGSTETLTQLWPWLWLGQWLHVGKNATMGMGGYTLQ